MSAEGLAVAPSPSVHLPVLARPSQIWEGDRTFIER